MITSTSIEAGFLSRLFSSQSKVIKKVSKWKKRKEIGWEKASIESRPRMK